MSKTNTEKVIREFKLTTLALRNKNTVFLLAVILITFGIYSYRSLPKELFPDIVIPTIMVQTLYPGNPPIDIENLINSNKYYEAEGYDLNTLYEQLLTFSSLLTKLKQEILPRIQNEAAIRIRKLSIDNKILYEMTLDNLPNNLKIFYGIISELYINIKKVDKRINSEENSLYVKLPYIEKIEKNLNI